MKETIGKIATDLMKKEAPTRDPIELEREMHKDYEKNIFECIEAHKKKYAHDFYIVVLTKKERLLKNVLRNYFFARLSCPTPEYDQTIYKYNRSHESISFLWTIPSKDTCALFKENAIIIDPKERELLHFVLDFEDGTLLKKAQLLNNEDKATHVIVNKGCI